MVPPALPPPLLRSASPIFKKMGEAGRGPQLRTNGRSRPSYNTNRFCEGNLAKGISSLGWSSRTVGRVGAFSAISRPNDSLNSFLITCLRAALLV